MNIGRLCRVFAHLLGLGPLLLRQELVLVAELDGAANAEDAVVALLGRQALEGQSDGSVLLLVEVVVPVGTRSASCFASPQI